MKKYLAPLCLALYLLTTLTACQTSRQSTDYAALAQAAIRLDVDIARTDNHKLYLAASRWIGVPYRSGGNDTRGIDCSGLTRRLYKEVYRIGLSRSSGQQKANAPRLLTRKELREGDLVFFSAQPKGKKVGHVGVYLKEGKFVHAAKNGVIVGIFS